MDGMGGGRGALGGGGGEGGRGWDGSGEMRPKFSFGAVGGN